MSLSEGDFDTARKYYKEALRNFPDNQSIKNRLKDIDVSLKAIAIVDFKNNNGDTKLDVFSKSIPADLTSLMIQKTGLPFTERSRLKEVLKEMQLPQMGLINPDTAPELGKIIGASQLISGSFNVSDDKITIHAKLIDTETGINIFSHSETGEIDKINSIETAIVEKLITSLAHTIATNHPIIMEQTTTLANTIDKALSDGGNEVSFTLEESTISFEFAKANIKPSSYSVLKEVSQVLNNHSNYKVYILGHTDNIGSAESNKTLSKRRANNVLKKFVDYGVKKNRLQAFGLGEDEPISSNATHEGRSINRRVGLLFKK